MTRTLALLIALLTVAGCALPGSEPQDPPEQARDYVWRDAICGDDDYSGVFVNTTRRTQSFEVWAAIYDNGRLVDRDVEYVVRLPQAGTETITFVFSTTGDSCKIESVSWR